MSDLTDTENIFTTHTMDTSSDHHDDKNLQGNDKYHLIKNDLYNTEQAHIIVALENEIGSTTSEKSIGT